MNKTILSQCTAATPQNQSAASQSGSPIYIDPAGFYTHRSWLRVVYNYFSQPEERALTARAYRDLEKAGLDKAVVDGVVEYLIHHGLLDFVVDNEGMYLYGGGTVHLWRHLGLVPAGGAARSAPPAYYARLLASVRTAKSTAATTEAGEGGAA
jgi:hypothetical protein